MARKFVLKKGLDLPILGKVESDAISEAYGSEVAILGPDFSGMKPSLLVKEGDSVKAGQVLFTCKKNEGLQFVSRFDGKVVGVNRGDKRAFQSLVLSLSGSQSSSQVEGYQKKSVDSYTAEEVRALLVKSGEWCSIRQRPFEKVASVKGSAKNLFITAIDTNPLAHDPMVVINKFREEFEAGVQVLAKLPENKTYICTAEGFEMPQLDNCEVANFKGPHPAGLPGTHIHFLAPVNIDQTAWHVGYQEVISIGHLFLTGELKKTKIVSLCGPRVKQTKLLEVNRGAQVSSLTKHNIVEGSNRTISGSVLNGRKAEEAFDYLGHFHNQVTVIEEDNKREFLGWQSPGLNKFSNKPIFLSKLMPGKKFALGSSTHGSKRAMVPIGMFEDVMPLDILPTQLLRLLVAKDLEGAQELGCLELAEEDLGLCTFVSPGKVDFGRILRENLNMIEKELL